MAIPTINDAKVYVPAQDFELSQRFYQDLGFTRSEGFGGTADFALGGLRFRLQDHYVKDWAENFMLVIYVDDVNDWHRHAGSVIAGGAFPSARIIAPKPVGSDLVLHLIDPTGVLLVFVQKA